MVRSHMLLKNTDFLKELKRILLWRTSLFWRFYGMDPNEGVNGSILTRFTMEESLTRLES
jgi:hypothetical protein